MRRLDAQGELPALARAQVLRLALQLPVGQLGASAPGRQAAVPAHVHARGQLHCLRAALGGLHLQAKAQAGGVAVRQVAHHAHHLQVLPLQRRIQALGVKVVGAQSDQREGRPGASQQQGCAAQSGTDALRQRRANEVPPLRPLRARHQPKRATAAQHAGQPDQAQRHGQTRGQQPKVVCHAP